MNAPHLIFDRKLLHRRQERAGRREPQWFLLQRAQADLIDRLGDISREFRRVAFIDTDGSNAVENYLSDRGAELVHCIDVNGETESLSETGIKYDLAISLLSMQWLNDLPGVFAQIQRRLKPDGLLLAAMIGGDTLTELRDSLAAAETEIEGGISPRISPFAEVRTLGGLLQRAGFALPVADVDRVIVRYSNALELMRDLRRMGATNVLRERSRKPLRRRTLFRAVEIYQQRFTDPDGRIRATFEILWLSGWTPHESQQQPLKPGSAKARLADALRVVELPAGETTSPKKN